MTGVIDSMPSTRLLISSRSSGVGRAMRPWRRSSIGVYAVTVMLLLPKPWNCWPIAKLSPWMIDTIAITDATPMMMPSVVRKLRNACARIECSAERTPSLTANQSGERVLRTLRAALPAEAGRLEPVIVSVAIRSLLRAAARRVADVLDDFAVAQPDDALAVRRDLGLVRDDDDRLAVGVQLVEQREDLDRRLRVEITGRLVREQDGRVRHERPRNRNALPLAARELIRQMIGALAEPHALEVAHRLGAPLCERHSGVDQRLHDVTERAHARQQIEALEYEADLLVAHIR